MKEKMFVLALAGVLSLPLAVAAPADAGSPHATPVLQAQDQTGGTQAEPTKAQRYYQRGVEYMNNSRFLDAVEQFQLALDENSDYIDAYRRLAYAYAQMGQTESEYYQDALDTYEDLEAKLPADDVDVRKNIAFVQAAMGDLDDAIATYKEILDITPEDCTIWTQIGDAQKLQADRMKADVDFFYDLALMLSAQERTASLQNAGFICTWEELVDAYGLPPSGAAVTPD